MSNLFHQHNKVNNSILMQKIKHAKSDAEIIELLKPYVEEKNNENIHFQKNSRLCKDEDTAKTLLTSAIKYSIENNTTKSMTLLTQCIACAPDHSLVLRSAYIKRSKALQDTEMYMDSIVDAHHALELLEHSDCYVDLECFHLWFDMGECYIKLSDYNNARTSLAMAKKLIESKELRSNLNLNEKLTILNIKLEEQMQSTICTNMTNKEESNFKFPTLGHINNEAPSISAAIAIQKDDIFGRHLIAKKDINTGDILIVEEAFASVLDPKCRWSHCTHCFQKCSTLIPCPKCDLVMYCSKQCKNNAENQYHTEECQVLVNYLQLYPEASQSERHCARILCTIGIKQLLQISYCEENKATKRYAGFNSTNPSNLISSDFYALLSLISHLENRTLQEICEAVIFALDLMKCFNLCDEQKSDTLAGIFFRMFLRRDSNAHKLIEVKQLQENYKINSIGSGIFVCSSLINHSCNPNVFRVNYGTILVHYANRPIKKGYQLMISYGVQFYTTLKTKREAYLKKYEFSCSCEACKNYWPLMNNIPDNPIFNLVNKKAEKHFHRIIALLSQSHKNIESKELYQELITLLYNEGLTMNKCFIHYELLLRNYYRSKTINYKSN